LLRKINTLWTRIALGLVMAQTAAAVFLEPSRVLTALGDTFPCLLAVLVILSFRSNRKQSSGRVRLFWILNETGFAILFLSQVVWFYYDVVLRRAAPNPVAGDGLFLLALVPTLASFALRPQIESASGDLRFRRLDFLLLLFWWVCLYLYFALPWQFVISSYPNYTPAYYVLALAEHSAALLAVGMLYVKSEGSWKRFYGQFFFALSIFAVGSLVQNIFIDRGLYYTGSLYDVPWGFSLGLLTVVGALGAKLEAQPARADVSSQNPGLWSARLAMIGVISLPLLAIAAAFDHHNPQSIVLFRLRLIFGAVLFLGTLTFLKLTSMDRELLRLIGLTEVSLESLKRVQNRILKSQRMAALGRLAFGATHEISNPLTAILGYAELLRDNPTLTQTERNSVQDIHKQVHRAQAAINGMRRFVRVEAEAEKTPSPELNTL
jgi:signal transduction histidine kinase